MKKLAIIGASCWQLPLIYKAIDCKIETHVFAWECGDVGESVADFFYPISIVEKDEILKKCQEIKIDGICSIGSDLAAITVNYVANKMGLIGNTMDCVEVSTNKHLMRQCFEAHNDPSPKSIMVESVHDLRDIHLTYPVIVKPVDRSGSRGITKLENSDGLEEAISNAIDQGFDKHALVEEYATGQEYSVEYYSWQGKHHFLALTHKFTTGAPHFIENGHFEPALADDNLLHLVREVVEHALDSLGIEYGASHTELKIASDNTIKIIEIGGRMGGDNIGAKLVELSTGFDFVKAVIDIALGIEPVYQKTCSKYAAIRFIFSNDDLACLKKIHAEHPEILIEEDVHPITDAPVTDSSTRFGYFIIADEQFDTIKQYLNEI